jgi:hypothetical protein
MYKLKFLLGLTVPREVMLENQGALVYRLGIGYMERELKVFLGYFYVSIWVRTDYKKIGVFYLDKSMTQYGVNHGKSTTLLIGLYKSLDRLNVGLVYTK